MAVEINIPKPTYTADEVGAYSTSETDDLLNDKVDKVAGKELSENDFTDALKTKLDGVQAGAEVNVNADWNAVSGDAQILNKPTIPDVSGLVPNTRTINGHTLTSNVVVSIFPLFCSKRINNTTTGGAIRYTGFIDGSGVQTTDIHRVVLPIATTFFNFTVSTANSQPGTGSSVFTILKNSVATGIVVTIPAGSGGGVFVNTTDELTVVQGDEISIEWVNNASGTSCLVNGFSMASK